MPGLYKDLPDESIRQAYDLFQNLEKQTHPKGKGKEISLSELFLVRKEDHFEFVKKSSLQGRWLGFKARVSRFFGAKDALNIEANLKDVANLLEKVSKSEEKFFSQAAAKISKLGMPIDASALHECINQLAMNTKKLKSHVAESKLKAGITYDKISHVNIYVTGIKSAAERHFFGDEKRFSEEVKKQLKSCVGDAFNEKEHDEIASVLRSYADTPKVLEALKHHDVGPLFLALCKNLAYVSDTRASDLQKIIEKIQPAVVKPLSIPYELREFATIFGDSFTKDTEISGSEMKNWGNYSSIPYINLFHEYLKEANLDTPLAKKLNSMLTNYVDLSSAKLSAEDVRQALNKALDKNEAEGVFLTGGWGGHAIMYEVLRQENGKYTFRVYNEGEGVQMHDQLQDKYKSKFAGCIEINDIPEKLMFRRSFLASIQALCRVPHEGIKGVNPDAILVDHILPMLDGMRRAMNPDIVRILSEQRGGTCTYRSLLAALAQQMSQQDYKQLKFEFKYFSLQKYLPQIEHHLKSPIHDVKGYEKALEEYAIIKRSVEKFSASIDKIGAIIPEEKIEAARALFLHYQSKLVQLNSRLLAFEKTRYETALNLKPALPTTISVQAMPAFQPQVVFHNVQSIKLLPQEVALKEAVESQPFEQAIRTLAQSNVASEAMFQLADILFKRIGSIKALDEIKFKNPEQSMQDLAQIARTIAGAIYKDQMVFRAERYGAYLLAIVVLESAYKQLPDDKRVLNKSCSFLGESREMVAQISTLCTSDPFWVDMLRTITSRSGGPHAPILGSILGNLDAAAMTMPFLINDVMAFWNSPANKALKERVDASIAQDRVIQEQEIKRLIDEQKQIIANCENQLATLVPQQAKLQAEFLFIQQQENSAELQHNQTHRVYDRYYDTYYISPPFTHTATYNNHVYQMSDTSRRIEENRRSINVANATIAEIPGRVRRDKRYWPDGFEKSPSIGGKTDAYRVTFFLAESTNGFFFQTKLGQTSLLPAGLMLYLKAAVEGRNIFGKLHENIAPLAEFRSEEDDDRTRIGLKIASRTVYSSYGNPPHSHNIYLDKIHDLSLKQLFRQILENPREGAAPRIVSELGKSAKFGQDIESDEAKEILSLCAMKGIQVESVLSFFQDEIEKVKKSDFVNIFHALLFDSDLLLKELEDPVKREMLIPKLQKFFTSNIKNSMTLNDHATAANLFWMGIRVQGYVSKVSDVSVCSAELMAAIFEQAMNPKYDGNFPMLFEALFAASYPILNKAAKQGIQSLNEAEKKLFTYAAVTHVMRSQFAIEKKEGCQARSDEIGRNKELLKECFSKGDKVPANLMQEALNRYAVPLLAKVYPVLDKKQLLAVGGANDLFATDDGTKISLTEGSIALRGGEARIYSKPVSDEVLQLMIEQKVLAKAADAKEWLCFIDAGYVHIHDKEKKVYYAVNIAKKQVHIKTQAFDWSLFVPEPERLALGNIELKKSFLHLQQGDKLFLCDPKTKVPIFQSARNQAGLVVLKKGRDLEIVDASKDGFFADFEDPKCTICLANLRGEIQQVLFTRLGITLEKKDGVFQVVGQEGWHVAKVQFIPHFGQRTGFLVLENDKGEKKVLFPAWEPKTKKHHPLNFPYEYEFHAENQRTGRVVECSFVNDKLEPKGNLEARYLLTKLYLEKGFIDIADELLSSFQAEQTSKSYTAEEKTLLEWIALKNVSKDTGSRTIKLQLRALYLLEKNSSQFVLEKPKSDDQFNKRKVELFREYFSRIGHMKPLDAREELWLLKQQQKERLNIPHLHVRIAELEGKSLQEPTSVVSHVKLEPLELEQPAFFSFNGSFLDKIRYKISRLSNTFPFNYQNVSDEEYSKYMPLVEKEARGVKDWQMARKNGLYQALVHMSLFSSNPYLRANCAYLLSSHDDISTYRGPRGVQFQKSTLPKPTAQPGSEGLIQLESIKPSEREKEFLSSLGSNYFVRTERELISSKEPLSDIVSPTSAEIKDKTTQKEFRERAKDLNAAQNLMKEEVYSVHPRKDITELQATLTEEQIKESALLATQEYEIVNSVASALSSNPVSHAQFLAKKREFPKIEELCLVASRRNFDDFCKKQYPELNSDGRKMLQRAVKQYLVQKQHVQHIGRALQLCEEYTKAKVKDPDAVGAILNDLGRSLEQKRAYDVDSDPHAMVLLQIETILNIKLRADQVKNIHLYAQAGVENRQIVVQMIMGSGKTAVLQPVLAFLFAEPDKLSSVVVPEALIEPVRDGLSKALGDSYETAVFCMGYDRQLAKKPEYLETFYTNLMDAKARGAVFLYTPRQKHSLLTSLKEAYHDYIYKNENRVELISKICNELQLHERVQIDEIHLIMNSKVIFKYPMGEKYSVDDSRASLVSSLVLELAKDKRLNSEISLDFANSLHARSAKIDGKEYSKEGADLTKDLFETTVLPQLVEIATRLLKSKSETLRRLFDPRIDINGYLSHFLSQTTPFDEDIHSGMLPIEEAAIHKNLPKNEKELQELIAKSKDPKVKLCAEQKLYRHEMVKWIRENIPDEETRKLLGECARVITKIMPNSLFKECGTHYGQDPKEGKYVARPYEAPKAPKPTVYSDPYEQVVFTTQQTLYYGVPMDAARKMLENMQKNAREEMKQGGIQFFETETYKNKFVPILGENAADLPLLTQPPKEDFLKVFQQALGAHTPSMLEFMQTFAFEQITQYTKSVSSTPQTLAGSSDGVFAYAGTVHEGIMARSMEVKLELGTDGKTMAAVQKKMDDGIGKVSVFSQQKKLTEQVVDRFITDPDLYVFIDSGGWLKEENVDEYAEKLLETCEKSQGRSNTKSIIFHNDKGAVISLERDGTGKVIRVPVSQSKYKTADGASLTLIAQKYETGTNIPQKSNAKALMSVRKNMTLGDALQSIFRMRKILYGQIVDFGLSVEVKNHVASGIVDGLLTRPEFKKLFNKESPLTERAMQGFLAKFGLPNELKEVLVKSTAELIKLGDFRNRSLREYLMQFSKCFAKEFDPSSKVMWRYFSVDQAMMQQEQNLLAGRQRMQEVIEAPIRRMLSDNSIPVQLRSGFFKAFEKVEVHETKDDPFEQMAGLGDFVDGKTAIEDEIKRSLQLFSQINENTDCGQKVLQYAFMLYKGPDDKAVIPYTKEAIRPLVEAALKSCMKEEDIPEIIPTGDSDVGAEAEIEQEQQVEQEVEEEQQVEQEQEVEVLEEPSWLDDKHYKPLVHDKVPNAYEVSEFFGNGASAMKTLDQLLPESVNLKDASKIECSPNLFIDNAALHTLEHGNYHLAARYMLIVGGPEESKRRYILASHEDAARIKEGISVTKIEPPRYLALVKLNGEISAISHKDAEAKLVNLEAKRLLVQSKFCLGRINFTKPEIDSLKEAIGSKNAASCQRFYKNLIRHLPSVAKRYNGSGVDNMFKEIEVT